MSAAPFHAAQAAIWRIELLGQVRAVSGDLVVTRFGSRKVVALLARLALFAKRTHSREELIDLLWPEADLAIGRNRLRQALFALRQALEPPGSAPVLLIDRHSVRLEPLAFSCDALDFESQWRARNTQAAQALYVGELMPGHYDEWVLDERNRLAMLADDLRSHAREPAAKAASTASEAMTLKPPAPTQQRLQLLPALLARFFGREDEMAELGRWLGTERLITLLGPGGSGKTRLATEVARREAANYAVVAFVALAECDRADELANRVRAALRLPDGPGDAAEKLSFYLSGRPCLLVLDNFEQLVAAGAAQALEQWLRSMPELQILVTSRRMLDAEGERCFDVAPLPLPRDEVSLVECAANPSVALFIDRARAARSGFHLHEGNRADVSALCAALEGIPLAIELAASHVHSVSVADMRAQMQAQMNRRFALWSRTGPRAARAPRHASLDAAIDWSWQMLSPTDQHRLAALSVFREGFSADAAAAVWSSSNADIQDVYAVLSRLIADSLVLSETGLDGSMRYRLFEMVREFVEERLSPTDRLLMRERQRGWFLQFAQTQAQAHARTLPLSEVPNLHQALRSSLEDDQALCVLTLSLATESHWDRRGVPPEVRSMWLTALDALRPRMAELTAHDAVQVHAARCLFARRLFETGDASTAVALADEAVAQAGDDAALLAPALAVQLRLRWKTGFNSDGGMPAALRQALALTDVAPNLRTRAELLNLLGEVLVLGLEDAHSALPYYGEALSLYEGLGDMRQAWDVRMGLGICAQKQRRFDDAIAAHTAVAAAAQALDDQLLLIDAYNNLAVACNGARRWEQAVEYGRQQLRLATRQYSRYMQVMALWNLARPLARSHMAQAAATAMAASAHVWVTQFGALAERDQRYVAKVKRLVTRQVGAVSMAALWKHGESLPLSEVVNIALNDSSTER
jgi:predicted ATPase